MPHMPKFKSIVFAQWRYLTLGALESWHTYTCAHHSSTQKNAVHAHVSLHAHVPSHDGKKELCIKVFQYSCIWGGFG